MRGNTTADEIDSRPAGPTIQPVCQLIDSCDQEPRISGAVVGHPEPEDLAVPRELRDLPQFRRAFL